MPLVISNLSQLSARGREVSRLLREIARGSRGPVWQARPTGREYIIGVHTGSPAQSDYRSWRFPTFVDGIHAMYFELWRQDSATTFYLYRAYLSVFRRLRTTDTEQELFSLHCDPNEPDNAAHAVYKQGPHLHLGTSQVPGPHAHIALNRCHLPQVLASVEAFTRAFHLAIVMIKEEVLNPLRN